MCLFYSFTVIEFGDSIVLFNIKPLFLFFLSYVIIGDTLEYIHFIVFGFAFIGTIFISQPTFIFGSQSDSDKQDKTDYIGYIVCILAGIFHSLSLIKEFV